MVLIDLRSDTVTCPNAEMRQSMSTALVGDDVYGEDPTVNFLEEKIANMFHKESALFFPSGTMSNLTAVLAWCSKRCAEIILGDQSHMFLFEQSGIAQFGGVSPRTVPNLPDGTMELEKIISSIRDIDIHEPITQLICIENTHNMCGGKVIPISFLKDLNELVKSYDIPIHLDGARIWNAITKLKIKPDEISKYVDSMTVCLSKGLGAPIGSVLIGSREFIQNARKIRKALGGGMRQVGILAAAGLFALDEFEKDENMIEKDHQRMTFLATSLLNAKAFRFDMPDTNILFMEILLYDQKWKTTLISSKISEMFIEKGILVSAWSPLKLRFVVHRNITDNNIQKIISSVHEISNRLASI